MIQRKHENIRKALTLNSARYAFPCFETMVELLQIVFQKYVCKEVASFLRYGHPVLDCQIAQHLDANSQEL